MNAQRAPGAVLRIARHGQGRQVLQLVDGHTRRGRGRLKIKSPLLKTGLQRHDAAIDAAHGLAVTDSVLHARLRGGDLPGTCHHLVNEKHFTWVR